MASAVDRDITRLEQVLNNVSQSPHIDRGNLDAAASLIIESICSGLAIERAGIWLLSEDKQSIECYLLLDKAQKQDNIKLSRQDFPSYFAALDIERTIAANNALIHEATKEFADVYLIPQQISSMLDCPIRHKGKMIGIICCEHRGDIRQWQSSEQVFVASLADLYGRAINANEVRKQESKLKALNDKLELLVDERTSELKLAMKNLQSAQTSLVESEKLAALGNLVAGVAHEVNTPLGISVTSTSHCIDELTQLKRKFDQGELEEQDFVSFINVMEDGLNLISRNLDRAADLVHSFKRTAADQVTLERETFNLSEYLAQISTPLRPLTRKQNIQLNIEIEPDIVVNSYPGAIAQIFTNLVSNCFRHAYPEVFSKEKIITLGVKREGDLVKLSYHDNGKGLTDEVKEKIFDPFFTTARNIGGTGLGMSIVYNLVKQKLGGEIELSSAPNQGLTINILINGKIS